MSIYYVSYGIIDAANKFLQWTISANDTMGGRLGS